MAVTITATPTTPVVSKGCKITFSLSAGGNYVRAWCSDAPIGSALRARLDNETSSRVEVFSNQATADSPPFAFQPDRPGRYVLIAQEYQRGASSFGGGYAGDPLGFDSEEKIVGESSLEIDFGQLVSVAMGVGNDTATLKFYVFGNNVVATTFELHGEATPDIVEPKSAKARNAASTMRAAARALAGQTATAILGSTDTIVFNLINKTAGHFENTTGSVHATLDSQNVPNAAYLFPRGNALTIKAVAEIVTTLGLHMNTDKSRHLPFTGSGVGSGDWHQHLSTPIADGSNSLLVSQPTTMDQAYAALGDCWRAYEAHRVNLDVHGAADSTYTLTALPPLCDLHRGFFAVLAAPSPAPAPAENPGAILLVAGCGARLI